MFQEVIKLRSFRLFMKMLWETHSSRKLREQGQIYIGNGKKEQLGFWKHIIVFLLFVQSLVHN